MTSDQEKKVGPEESKINLHLEGEKLDPAIIEKLNELKFAELAIKVLELKVQQLEAQLAERDEECEERESDDDDDEVDEEEEAYGAATFGYIP